MSIFTQPTRADLNLHNALRVLRKNGFAPELKREDKRTVITVHAAKEEINSKMQGIIDATSYGILIRFRTK